MEKLKRIHLTLLASDLEAFKKECKSNYRSISSELKKMIHERILKQEGKSND